MDRSIAFDSYRLIDAPPIDTTAQRISRPGGPLLAVLVYFASVAGELSQPAAACAAVAIVCAVWWIFEAYDIAVVGLVPFVALPVLGIADHNQVAAGYGHSMILLLLGGSLLSIAMERSGAHRRVALWMIHLVGGGSAGGQSGGGSGRKLVLGFMLATAGLSMWISNSATTLMMLPIAVAVLSQCREDRLRVPLLLGIAYAASVGGMSTPIGTPPNVIFISVLQSRFEAEMSFAGWMSYGLPVTAIMLPIIWWWLTRRLPASLDVDVAPRGRIRSAEIRVMAIFVATALLWVFRTGPAGGWRMWMPGGPDVVGDATVALAAAVVLFVCPDGEKSMESEGKSGGRLLRWSDAAKVPWGILIMFGGGLALATGFEESGLSAAIGGQLVGLVDVPGWLLVLCVCLLVTFLTEITSSTATAMLLLPIVAEVSVAAGLPPEQLMIPATISCSCAFMLPVATAPNVIVFGAGGVRTSDMARNGLVLNVVGVIVVTTMVLVRG